MTKMFRRRGDRQNNKARLSVPAALTQVDNEVKPKTVVTKMVEPKKEIAKTTGTAKASGVTPPKTPSKVGKPNTTKSKPAPYQHHNSMATGYVSPIEQARKDRKKRAKKVTKTMMNANILYDILSTMRPAASGTELRMIQKHIDPLDPTVDTYGNRIVTIDHPNNKPSKTLFSCHTDTVHHTEGIQKLYLDHEQNELFVTDSSCLGADDGTGIYIMLMMIKAKVPGTYIFHRAEEIGCKGSHHIAENNAGWLKQFDRAVAFDRKGKEDLIIAQSPGLLASEEFGDALCRELNFAGVLKFKNSKYGSITDTASYFKHIPECINMSVGYERQHTSNETQDVGFLNLLIPRLIATKWDKLPTIRKAGPAAPKYASRTNEHQQWQGSRGFGNQSLGQRDDFFDDDDLDDGANALMKRGRSRYSVIPEKKLALIVMQEPRVAIELLIEAGLTIDDLWDAEFAIRKDDQLIQFAEMYGL